MLVFVELSCVCSWFFLFIPLSTQPKAIELGIKELEVHQLSPSVSDWCGHSVLCSLEKGTWKEDVLQGKRGAHTEAFASLNPCLTARSFSTSYHQELPFVKERGRVTALELNQEETRLTLA